MSKRLRDWLIVAAVLALALGGAYVIVARNNARMNGTVGSLVQQFLH